jgi:hypothetical protein
MKIDNQSLNVVYEKCKPYNFHHFIHHLFNSEHNVACVIGPSVELVTQLISPSKIISQKSTIDVVILY